jgi:hypothetical protein
MNYSAFFLGVVVLLGFAAASSTAAAGAGFFVVDLFNLALIALLRLELPYESFQILPFFDFLSPLPIVLSRYCDGKYKKVLMYSKT